MHSFEGPLFSRRNPLSGGRRSRRPRRSEERTKAAFERLEGRMMLAITTSATPGDQLGQPLRFVADSVSPIPNTLSVALRESSGGIIASVDMGDGSGFRDYSNFEKIEFVGVGGVTDKVVLTSPYEVDLVGFGGSGQLPQPVSVTNWQVDASFNQAVPGLYASFDLFGADVLEVTANAVGGSSQSTIAGTFQPTDAGVVGVPSIVLEDRGVGVTGNTIDVETFGLAVTATNGNIDIEVSVSVGDDLSIVAPSGKISFDGSAVVAVASTAGDIVVQSVSGNVTLNDVRTSALSGNITISSAALLTIAGGAQAELFAPNGTIGLTGQVDLTVNPGLSIVAERLELFTNGNAPIDLTNVAIDELEAFTRGALDVTSSTFVTITDGDPATAAYQISATEFALTAPAGIRVVDGLNVGGAIVLSSWDAAVSTSSSPVAPATAVQFVVTAGSDTLGSAFEGELRDMIGYLNRNGINPQALVQGIVTQPMSIVFDEAGSPISAVGEVAIVAALPAISRPVTFDGSLPDGSSVGIDGAGTGSVVNGLRLVGGSSGSTIRDAAFYGFARGAGVRVESAENVLTGLSIGLDRDGVAVPNAVGIDVSGAAAIRNIVGVETAGVDSGNVIAANTVAGVLIRSGANFTGLYGNQIGQDGLGNTDGVWVQGAVGTIVGGVGIDLQNAIEFNTDNGVRLTNVRATTTKYGSQVVGNVIANNGATGVLVEGGMRNVIGGTQVGQANVFEGNRIGIQMTVDGVRQTWGNQVVGNRVSGTSEQDVGGILVDRGYANVIQANTVTGLEDWGIRLFATAVARGQDANQVIQNTVTQSGSTATEGGIVVENSSGQVVGGPGTRANVVASNGGSGIVVIGGTGPNAAGGNLIQGNLVGTDAAGVDRGNDFDGIRVQGSLANVIQGNTIRFNDLGDEANPGAGISVYDAVSPVAGLANRVVSNTVSDNAVGILVSGGARTQIGGSTSGAANWVFRNGSDGIRVAASGATGAARSTVIQGNRIGMATVSAPAGNSGSGIHLIDTVGTVVDSGNVVANSGGSGIRIVGGNGIAIGSPAGRGNSIQSNGTTQTANGIEILPPNSAAGRTENVTVVGNTIGFNSGYGILVGGSDPAAGSVTAVTIGRSTPGSAASPTANRITQNGLAGVFIDRARAVKVYGNTIVNNGGQPIEWATSGGFDLVLSSARRTTNSRSGQFEVQGTVARNDVTSAERVQVSIYGTNTASGQRFLLGQVSVVVRAGLDSAPFRIFVGSVGRQFDRIEATLTVGLGTVVSSNSLVV